MRDIKIDSPNALAMYRRAQEKFAELDHLKRDLRLKGYDRNSYTPEMLNVQRSGAQLTAIFCEIAAQEIARKYEMKAARLRELQAKQKDERRAEKRSLKALRSHIRKADDPRHSRLAVRRRKSMQGHLRKQEKIGEKVGKYTIESRKKNAEFREVDGFAYQQERALQDVEAKFAELAIQQERHLRQERREADRIARLRRMAEELRYSSIPHSYHRSERSYTYPFNDPRTGNTAYGGYTSNIRTASGTYDHPRRSNSDGLPRRAASDGLPRVFVRVDPVTPDIPRRAPNIRRSSSGLFDEHLHNGFIPRATPVPPEEDRHPFTESPEPYANEIPRQQHFASGSTPRRNRARHSQARRPSPTRTVSSVATSQVTRVSELNRQGREVPEAPTPPLLETPPLSVVEEEDSQHGYY